MENNKNGLELLMFIKCSHFFSSILLQIWSFHNLTILTFKVPFYGVCNLKSCIVTDFDPQSWILFIVGPVCLNNLYLICLQFFSILIKPGFFKLCDIRSQLEFLHESLQK
jgi:hypothetical protein